MADSATIRVTVDVDTEFHAKMRRNKRVGESLADIMRAGAEQIINGREQETEVAALRRRLEQLEARIDAARLVE